MIEEHYLESRDVYMYILLDGTTLFTREKYIGTLQFKNEEEYKAIVKELMKITFNQTKIYSQKERIKKKKKDTIASFAFALAAVSCLFVESNKDSYYNQKLLNMIKTNLEDTKDLDVALDEIETFINEKGLSKEKYNFSLMEKFRTLMYQQKTYEEKYAFFKTLYPTLCEYNLNQKVYCDYLYAAMLKDMNPKEVFFRYVSLSIDANPHYDEEEKEILKRGYENHILKFGDYYESNTIFYTLYKLSTTDSLKRYGIHTATYNGRVATYDPSWEDCEETFLHEMIHSNQGEMKSIYEEPAASFLSGTKSYSKERALITMLGILGEERVVLSGLINSDSNRIWKNIELSSTLTSSEVDYLRYLVESLSPYYAQQETEKQILELIHVYYDKIYNSSWKDNAAMKILSEIYLGNQEDYENIDTLVLNGEFLVNYKLTEDIKIPISIPLGVRSASNIDLYWYNIIKDIINEENEYYYFLELLLEKEDFELLKSYQPDCNETLSDTEKQNQYTLYKKAIDIIRAVSKKDIKILTSYYESKNGICLELIDLEEFDYFLNQLLLLKQDEGLIYFSFSPLYQSIFPKMGIENIGSSSLMK